MAYASIAGRARTSARKPQAHAICDRCGFRYNFVDLTWQFDWRGAALQNLRILVCRRCIDKAQDQLRAIVLPADPTPIVNARTQDFEVAETDYRAVSRPTVFDQITGIPIPSDDLLITEDCENRATYPFGRPVGLNQNAVMPYNGAVQRHYGVELELLSVTSNGTCTITVTCRKPHGLHTDNIQENQISINGLANSAATGFFSVTVLTATAFTYDLYAPIAARALLQPSTRAVTCLVGLPRGYKRIPKIYGPTVFPEVEALVCFFELEDGTGMFALEDGGGFLQIEQCMQPPLSDFFFSLEDDTGSILLENNVDFLEQEDGP